MLAACLHRSLVSRTGLAAAALLVLGGCGRACTNDRPYVPPARDGAEAGVADAGASSSLPVPLEDGGAGLSALVAPPRTTTWRVEGIEIAVPDREIILALPHDFDGDGQKDVLVLVRPPPDASGAPSSSSGELVYVRGGPSGGLVPGAIVTGPPYGVAPTCVPVARLERVGPRSAYVEIGSSCPKIASSRGIFVVRLAQGPAPTVAFDAAVIDPESAPKLRIDVDATDRDRDGIDDVALRLTIEGGDPPFGAGPKLSAKLAFFDRPAGPSRDPDEPEASLKTIASQVASRAKSKDRESAPALVRQMRALYRAMCTEGGAPRITKIHGGSAVSCGTSKALEDAGVSEVRAVSEDALRAFAAAAIAQLPPATKTSARTTELADLLKQAAPPSAAKSARVVAAVADVPRGSAPEWGPLAFEAGGKLLVRRGTTTARVDPTTGESTETDMSPWPAHVISPDGKSRWLETYRSCEGAVLHATIAPVSEGDAKDVLVPIAPRLGAKCTSARGEPVAATPLAWTARGLEAVVAGEPVLLRPESGDGTVYTSTPAEPTGSGSPRSPGGTAIAIPVRDGVLVAKGSVNRRGRWALYQSSELQPYAELRQCTITDDGETLACVGRAGRVIVASF